MKNLQRRLIGLFLAVAATTGFGMSQHAEAAPIPTDFVFMIDASGSMAGEIGGVAAGFGAFASSLDANAVDARFAIVMFGGSPELVLDFTTDTTAVQNTLNAMSANGAVSGVHNNHNANPEAGLETIRMVLGGAVNNTLDSNNISADGNLSTRFRSNARKNLILATDEDSDLPSIAANRFSGQGTGNEPSNPTSDQAWQDEIDATATAVIQSQAYLNMLINTGDSPSASQYGDYAKDVSDANLLNFDEAATLAALQADATTVNSLQAQVLNANLVARTFNVSGANTPAFVSNFFAAKLEEVTTDPGLMPEPAALGMFSLGLAGLGLASRRRKTH